MKIVFLCGSLELGKDGVGDYTRRLAGELMRNGHTVEAIALNDLFVSATVEEDQTDEEQKIRMLRLPATATLSERLSAAQQRIHTFHPDWISLQFVLYAFHPKGLPFQWIAFLKELSINNKWHIMLHELWIGSKKQDSIKTKLIGVAQQFIVKKILHTIAPSDITTNLPYYQVVLKKIRWKASVLPVFSNIPFGSLQNNGLSKQVPIEIQACRTEWLVIAMFGGVSSSAEVTDHFEWLVQKAGSENKKILLVHLGRSGSVVPFFENIRQKNLCELLVLGEQSPADIASFFLQADLGVSTYDAEFLEKSGSIAAMLYNKLPVVLLKKADKECAVDYPYAKFVKDIPSLTSFSTQSTDWSRLFSLQNAAAFYTDLFMQNQ